MQRIHLIPKSLSAIVLGILFFLAGCLAGKKNLRKNLPDSLDNGDIIHLASGKKVPNSVLEKFLSFPEILYVGESHENLEAHRVQLELLKAFHAKFGPDVVIGMEMFKRPYQAVLDDWTAGRLDEKTFLKKTHWEKEWGFDYRLYRDLWNFARDRKIPIIALNATNELKNTILSKGLSGLNPEEKKNLPEIDESDFYHRFYLQNIFSLPGHSQSQSKNRFEKFYQVQCFWEDFMAESISKYLTSPAGRGKKMIVIIGNGHIIYDFGVPKRVFGRTHLPYLSVSTYTPQHHPEHFDPILKADIPLEPADFLMVVPLKRIERKHALLGVVLEKPDKVRIIKMYEGSPAAKAGLKEGDIITALDGEEVTEIFDITYTLKQKETGSSCSFSIIRGDISQDITVEFFSWDFHAM